MDANIDENEVDILYIEDDDIDVLSVQREFKKVNHLIHIATAGDGIQAMDMLYGRNNMKKLPSLPKVILLDVNLPRMGGIEFLKNLRADANFNSIVVYLLTSSYNTQEKLAIKDLNVAGCIVKPLLYSDALNVFWGLLQ